MSKFTSLIPKHFRDTFQEFMIIILYSLLPIIVGTLVLFIDNNGTDFLSSLEKQLERGELYLWATTLMAGVVYSVLKEPPVKWKMMFTLYCSALCLFTIIYHSVSLLKSPQMWITEASYYVGFVTAIILFVNILFEQKAKQNPSQRLHDESKNYAEDYAKRRTN